MNKHQKLLASLLLIGFSAVFTLQSVHAASTPAPTMEDSIRNSISHAVLPNLSPSHLYKSANAWLYSQTGYTFESIWGHVKTFLNFILSKTIAGLQKLLSYIE